MRTFFLLLIPTLAAAASAQTRSVSFSESSGLAAEADFTLKSGGTQLEIRLRNRTTAVPAGFSNSDQLLTGISFDLGAPGNNASDPTIVSGSAKTGPSSHSVNFDVMNVGANRDVSGEWGFGNGGTTNLLPNIVSGNQAGTTPFGGLNLDGPTNLNGPQAGLVATFHLSLAGLGAIEDEIFACLDLSEALSDLDFLDNGARIEYGSDAAFLDDCPESAHNVVVNDPLGFNLDNGLLPVPGQLPQFGTPNFTVQMDDPANQCNITPGSPTVVVVNDSPLISVLMPNAGCAPDDPGNLMINVFDTFTHISGPVTWAGPGSPALHVFAIPDSPALCGGVCRGQGFWIDTTGPSSPIILTNVVEFVIGP